MNNRNTCNSNSAIEDQRLVHMSAFFAGTISALRFPEGTVSPSRITADTLAVKEISITGDVAQRIEEICQGNDNLMLSLLVTSTSLLLQSTGIIAQSEEPIQGYRLAVLVSSQVETTKGFCLIEHAHIDESIGTYAQEIADIVDDAIKYAQIDSDALSKIVDANNEKLPDDFFEVTCSLEQDNPPTMSDAGVQLMIKDGHPHSLRFQYRVSHLDEFAASGLLDGLQKVLVTLCKDPNKKINDLAFSDLKRRDTQAADSIVANPAASSIWSAFQNIVHQHPQAKAVSDVETSYTYEELYCRVESLSAYLQKLVQAKLGNKALIWMESRTETIVLILACLKVGVTFVPIDSEAPWGRVEEIMKQCDSRLLFTDDATKEIAQQQKLVTYSVSDAKTDMPDTQICNTATGDSIAYIIFTSGTTGKPKGVEIRQSALANYANWAMQYLHLSCDDRTGLVSSMAFDLGYTNIFGALLSGAEVVLFPKDIYHDTEKLVEQINLRQITTMKLAPSLFSLIVDEVERSNAQLSHLHTVLLGGEQFPITAVERFSKYADKCRFVNHYGPTETTIGALARFVEVNDRFEHAGMSIIGSPITNTRAYVVDAALRPLPDGVPGELVIAGDGLAAGYLNDRASTESAFIEAALLKEKVVYRTRDKVRYISHVGFQFMGRLDRQIKINGYRVEPAEVADNLQAYPSIQKAVVKPLNHSGRMRLCAYYTADKTVEEKQLREFMESRVSSYMVPWSFTHMESMPVTANGKINFSLLPDPIGQANVSDSDKPKNQMEQDLVAIWSEILGLEDDQIGVNDEFVSLGGDSIGAMQMVGKLREVGVDLQMKDIFELKTIRRIVEMGGEGKTNLAIIRGPETGEVPLGPAERRWFKRIGYFKQWNQAFSFEFDRCYEEADIDLAMRNLVEYHDMLHSQLTIDSDGITRNLMNTDDARLFRLDSEVADESRDVDDVFKLLNQSIQPENGINLAYCYWNKEVKPTLTIAVHHSVIDGVSWRIIKNDIETLLDGENLPQRTASFKQWSQAVQNDQLPESEIEYWSGLQQLSPSDQHEISENGLVKNAIHLSRILSPQVYTALMETSSYPYHMKRSELLIAAAILPLAALLQSDGDLLINLEGYGRIDTSEKLDLSRTVGWFTSIYPVRFNATPHRPISDLLIGVKELLRSVPQGGAGYNILRYMQGAEISDLEPRACFNYLGSFSSTSSSTLSYSAVDTRHTLSQDSPLQYEVAMNLISVDGAMEISVTASGKHTRQELETLLQQYETSLLAFIEFNSKSEASQSTPSDYPAAKLTEGELSQIKEQLIAAGLDISVIEAITPLTPFQQYSINSSDLTPQAMQGYYHQHTLQCDTPLEPGKLSRCVQQLVMRHSALRTVLVHSGNRRLQVQLQSPIVTVKTINLDNLSDEERTEYIQQYSAADGIYGFREDCQPLMRITYFPNSDAPGGTVCWSNQHIILDGWSRMILLDELLELLKEDDSSASDVLLEDGFRDYAQSFPWDSITSANRRWNQYLDGYEPVAFLGTTERLQDNIYSLRSKTTQMNPSQTQQLRTYASANGVTLSDVIQASVGMAMGNVWQVDDVVISEVAADRSDIHIDSANAVGPLITVTPMRWQKVKNHDLGDYARLRHSDSERMQPDKPLYQNEKHFGGNLFQVALAIETYPVSDRVKKELVGNPKITEILSPARTGSELTIYLFINEGISISISANPLRISRDKQEDLLQEIKRILSVASGMREV